MTLRRLAARACLVIATGAGWLALHPAPFTMHVVDEAGQDVVGARIVTDNGIVCFTRLDGRASWTELSLLRRTVAVEVHDDYGRYADAFARLDFDSGGRGTVKLHRTVHTTQSKSQRRS